VYGKGLCFGMAVAALRTFSGQTTGLRRPLADLSLAPNVFSVLPPKSWMG
jgi:hypothetical protein